MPSDGSSPRGRGTRRPPKVTAGERLVLAAGEAARPEIAGEPSLWVSCGILPVPPRSSAPNRPVALGRRTIGLLEEHGEVERLPPGTVLDGKPRREAWTLVP